MQQAVNGRLPKYEVEKLSGTYTKRIFGYDKGITMKEEERPRGFMVYLPRGHSMHIETEKELKRLNLSLTTAPIIDMGLGEEVPPGFGGRSDVSLKSSVERMNKPRYRRPKDEPTVAEVEGE